MSSHKEIGMDKRRSIERKGAERKTDGKGKTNAV